MWITNKKVELTSNALVVVAVAADEDDIELMDYQVATLDVVSDKSSFFCAMGRSWHNSNYG